MKKIHELFLNALSFLDEDIIERNTVLRNSLLQKASATAAQAPRRTKKTFRTALLAACLCLVLIAGAIAVPMMLRPDEPSPQPPVARIEKTSVSGETEIYTVTYEDGSVATFTVINKTQNGISGLEVNDAGIFSLRMTSGNALQIGSGIGLRQVGTTAPAGITGATFGEQGELSLNLANKQDLSLGQVEKAGAMLLSAAEINEAGELTLRLPTGEAINLGRVVGEKGEDGIGIAEITLVGGSDLTITLTDGTAINLGNIKGADGKSAYEIYCEAYGYEGTEEEWLFDLVNGGLAIKQKFTVTFDSVGGSQITPQEVTDGSKATEPTPPTRYGYTFLGWYYGEELWSFNGYSVTQNMTLTAKWEAVQYFLEQSNFDLHFNLQGGSFTMVPFIKRFNEDAQREETVYGFHYDFESGWTYSIPTKEGYRFLGWTWEGQETPVRGTPSVQILNVMDYDGYSNGGSLYQEEGVATASLNFRLESIPLLTAHWEPLDAVLFDLLPVSGDYISHPKFSQYLIIGAPEGTEVRAIADGFVTSCSASGGDYPKTRITIVMDDGLAYHIQGVTNEGWKVGDRIHKGDVIGQIVLTDISSVLAANGFLTVPHCFLAFNHYFWVDNKPDKITYPDAHTLFTEECLAAIGYTK